MSDIDRLYASIVTEDSGTGAQGTPQRKRGAQPGNHNALKHGFYTRNFPQPDLSDLDTLETLNVESEIDLLRIFIRRTIESAMQSNLTAAENAALLRSIAFASQSIARLCRVYKQITVNGKIDALDQFYHDMHEKVVDKLYHRDQSS
jgi:hypothetical protein